MSELPTAKKGKVKKLFSLAFCCVANTTDQNERKQLLSIMLKTAIEEGHSEYVRRIVALLGRQTANKMIAIVHENLSSQQKKATVRELFS